MNDVFSSHVTPDIMVLFMGLFLVITLKNADGITPRTVQQSNSAGANVMDSRYPCFSCSGGIQGLVLENLEEWMNRLSFKRSSPYSVFSQQGFVNKYSVVGRSNCTSQLDIKGSPLCCPLSPSTCLNWQLNMGGEAGIPLENWALLSLSTSKTRTLIWSCLQPIPVRKWMSKLGPQSYGWYSVHG